LQLEVCLLPMARCSMLNPALKVSRTQAGCRPRPLHTSCGFSGCGTSAKPSSLRLPAGTGLGESGLVTDRGEAAGFGQHPRRLFLPALLPTPLGRSRRGFAVHPVSGSQGQRLSLSGSLTGVVVSNRNFCTLRVNFLQNERRAVLSIIACRVAFTAVDGKLLAIGGSCFASSPVCGKRHKVVEINNLA
jgi:hypothetical protein